MSSGPFFDQPGRDGRRRSDPLKDVDGSPAVAPDWQLNRIVSAQDAAVFTDRSKGCNFGHYGKGRFKVEVYTDKTLTSQAATASNPNVEVQRWSESAGKFVQEHVPVQKTGVGAGLGYTFEVDASGGILICKVTNAPSGSEVIAIFAQGYDLDHSL